MMNLTFECASDEGDVLRGNALDSLLNDMVAILIFDKIEYDTVLVKFFDQRGLLLHEDRIESLSMLATLRRMDQD